MDELSASLIMEFILRQPIDDWLAKDILLRLPLPSLLRPILKKTLFIRCLSSDLSSIPIRLSDHTLDYLELLEQLGPEVDPNTQAPSPALVAAYCAVAAELTVAPLRDAGYPLAEAEFLDAAERIWKCRIPDLEQSEGRGLVGRGLREWRRWVEDAVACEAARERLLRLDTRGEAVAALAEYIRVAVGEIGPPLLELAATAVCRAIGARLSDTAEPGVSTNVVTTDPDVVAEGTDTAAVLTVQDQVENNSKLVPVGADEFQNGTLDPPPKPVNSGGPSVIYVSGSSIETNAQFDATKVSVAKGRLESEAAEFVQQRTVEPEIDLINPGHSHGQLHAHMARPPAVNDDQATSSKGYAVEKQGEKPAEVPRTSLMERNPTARTYQWDDCSLNTLSEKSEESPKRPRLSTPKGGRQISPLKLYENNKNVKRRRTKRWTPQEEDALREAVKKYGVGSWKLILRNYSEAFDERTEVDLKDKWRNMSRYKL